MIKKTILLLVLLVTSAIMGGLIIIYELSSYTSRIVISVDEINSNPSAWVNKTVIVKGRLSGPLGFIPEAMPPWNYILYRSNETIYKPGSVYIGVLWKNQENYGFKNVMVFGVVREGHWIYLYGNRPTCYYIEAVFVFP
jgi:hypothetical protein